MRFLGAFLLSSVYWLLSAGYPVAATANIDGDWSLLFQPAGRWSPGIVWDPQSNQVVMFGGSGEDLAYHDDVWTLRPQAAPRWTETQVAGPTPGSRSGNTTVYDPVRHRLIVFAGLPGTGPGTVAPPYTYANDVWALSLSNPPTWSRITVSSGPIPPARSFHTAIYDPVRDRMIIFGGQPSGSASGMADTWALSLADNPTWTQLASSPVPQMEHTAVYDPVRDRMLVLGRKVPEPIMGLWALSLGSDAGWTQLAEGVIPLRRAAPAAYDPYQDRLLVMGGFDQNSFSYYSDIWAYPLGSNQGWSTATPLNAGPGRVYLAGAVHDPTDRRLVFTGSGTDVWCLSLEPYGTWTHLYAAPVQPSYRYGHVGVYDEPRQRMVVFGGEGASDTELWSLALDGEPVWTPLVASGSPNVRSQMVGALDTRRQRLIVHGGNPAQTWGLNLEGPPTWTQLDLTGQLPHHWAGHVGIYDPVRDRLIVFGGDETNCSNPEYCETDFYREVWSLNLEGAPSWTRIQSQGEPPPALWGACSIFDPSRDRLLIQGGEGLDGTSALGRTWALSLGGSPTWTVAAEAGPPEVDRVNHSGIYDPVRDRLVIYSGVGNGTSPMNAWALELSSGTLWRRLEATDPPLMRRWDHVAIHDRANDRMIIHSGYDTRTTVALNWSDKPTSVLVAPADPVVTPTSVTLLWFVADEVEQATLWRQEESGDWVSIATLQPDGANHLAFEDRQVRPGRQYGYKLELLGHPGSSWGEMWVTIPSVPGLALRVQSNPVAGMPAFVFALPSATPARLDLFDVLGRAIASREVGSFGIGTHRVSFDVALSPGVFFARLTQGGTSKTARLISID